MVQHADIDHTGITGVGGSGGTELDYVQITSQVNITGTNEAGANTIITGTSQAYANTRIKIEVFSTRVDVGPTNGASIIVLLYDGGTVLGRIGAMGSASQAGISPFSATYFVTPTAATHQYIVKAYRNSNDGVWYAGSGGTGAPLPSFLRVTLA